VTAAPHINVGEALVNLAHCLTYEGSLTPTCSETVTWFVLEQAAQVSQAQADAFPTRSGRTRDPCNR